MKNALLLFLITASPLMAMQEPNRAPLIKSITNQMRRSCAITTCIYGVHAKASKTSTLGLIPPAIPADDLEVNFSDDGFLLLPGNELTIATPLGVHSLSINELAEPYTGTLALLSFARGMSGPISAFKAQEARIIINWDGTVQIVKIR